MRLFIIGNGFDLHHGLKTSYRDYALFLQTRYPDVMDNAMFKAPHILMAIAMKYGIVMIRFGRM